MSMTMAARAAQDQQHKQPQQESSRSEKLLKTLLRDELEAQHQSSRPTHRRRHSHAVTPSDGHHSPSSSLLFHSQHGEAGAARARTHPPASSHLSHYPQAQPRSRSNTRYACKTALVYGGDAEGGPRTSTGAYTHSPTTTRRRETSPSPSSSSSPVYHASPTSSPVRPSPQHQPHEDMLASNSTTRKRQSLPPSLCKMPMTPPEKALRARLERVLMADAHAAGATRGNSPDRATKSLNEVRDEVGGWPWREKEHDLRDTVCLFPFSCCSCAHCV